MKQKHLVRLQQLLSSLLLVPKDLNVKLLKHLYLEDAREDMILNEEDDTSKTDLSINISPDKDIDIEEANKELLLLMAALESSVELSNKNNLSKRLAQSQTMDRGKKCSALLEILKEAENILRDPLVKEEKLLLSELWEQVLDVTGTVQLSCTVDYEDQPLQFRSLCTDSLIDDEMVVELVDQHKQLLHLYYLFESLNKVQANLDLAFSSVGILSEFLKKDKYQDEIPLLIQLLKELWNQSWEASLALLELSKEPRTILSEPPWIKEEKLLWLQLQKEAKIVTELLANLELNTRAFNVGIKASGLIRSHLNSLKIVLHQRWQTLERYKVSLFNTFPGLLHSTSYKKLVPNVRNRHDAVDCHSLSHYINFQSEEMKSAELSRVFDSKPAIENYQHLIAALDKHQWAHMLIDELITDFDSFISTYSSRMLSSISSAIEPTENKFGTVLTAVTSRMRSPARSTSGLYQLVFSERALNKLRHEYSDDQKVKSWLDKATSLAAVDGEQYYFNPHPIPVLYDMTCCGASPNDSSCEGVQALVEFVVSNSSTSRLKAQPKLSDRRHKRKSMAIRNSKAAHRKRFRYSRSTCTQMTSKCSPKQKDPLSSSENYNAEDESDSKDSKQTYDHSHRPLVIPKGPKRRSQYRKFQRILAEARRPWILSDSELETNCSSKTNI